MRRERIRKREEKKENGKKRRYVENVNDDCLVKLHTIC